MMRKIKKLFHQSQHESLDIEIFCATITVPEITKHRAVDRLLPDHQSTLQSTSAPNKLKRGMQKLTRSAVDVS
jgi:hypothetical protein